MRKRNVWSTGLSVVAVVLPSLAFAHLDTPPEIPRKGQDGPQRVFVLDGSTVHNVGELQMHVGNWGQFGSLPGSGYSFATAPSARWPAGSTTEYLYVAGLWVGAIKNGLRAVSTSAYAFEFRPSDDPIDVMYRSSEGTRNGSRAPSSTADDDNDGVVDEDWLNGRDDDGDGRIDEDYAAISRQMFVCQYTDDQPKATELYPEHNPLHLHVRQESYQWEEDRFDDFVGAQFFITNTGDETLENVYIGFFADGDAGQLGTDNYWADDATGRIAVPAACTDLGPVSMDIAYTYDADGDDGKTPGYLGILFLDHTTDPTGVTAPQKVGITSYANFAGDAPFANGGDPGTDAERYELLSDSSIEKNGTAGNGRDYRMLMATGPFKELLPGSTLTFQTAFVVGPGRNGMLTNAASAQITFEGAWFNLDLDANGPSGYDGRETIVYGPATVNIDSCAFPPPSTEGIVVLNKSDEFVWINNDCRQEQLFKDHCGYTDSPEDQAKYMTGINGNERQIFWLVGTAPPPPVLRIDDTSTAGVTVYWDNFSETKPDVKSLRRDFEGYRLFRADNWTRPIGTSTITGPPNNLWKLLTQMDIVNNFGEDTGLDRFRYEPLTHILSPSDKRDMIGSMKLYMTEYPGSEPPCPQGVTPQVCDTLFALAAWEMGNTSNGRQYYRYVDRSIHRGRPYFYAVTAADHSFDSNDNPTEGLVGDPSSNFTFIEPGGPSQVDYAYNEDNVYVVPNPATTESLQPWTLGPTDADPTGIKVEFRNLPSDAGTIRIFTLAGDLVEELPFDGRGGSGTVQWNLVSRNGQDVTSGVYLFAVDTNTNSAFKRKIGKFVVIR